ncbi:S41 family peptidase [Nonomuraea sp. NBC_01738]|uniref:S41 family peptidase n=1 Tax=Nonomuraea sp. NBC_01738 TaxID=2976003 RepID=UPI002E0D60B0|nr:S41 family peptidase [Nonomuraea sp. NBC_01738]
MGEAPPLTPTTADTLRQAYDCLLTRYAGAPVLNHQTLLAAAFAGFTQELQRRGEDRADATMPALTGDRSGDWNAFAAVYRRVSARLDPTSRQPVAAAAMTGMVAALHDNHAAWVREEPGPPPKPGVPVEFGTGIAGYSPAEDDPAGRLPLFITMIRKGSPAARLGVRPGDVIRSVDGVPAAATRAIVSALLGDPVTKAPVRLALHRPATGRDWTVRIRPAAYAASPLGYAERLKGGIAYVKLAGFVPGGEKKVFADLARMREDGALRGLVLDLRGNGGGFPGTANKLVSAFAHGKTIGYLCDVRGSCEPKRTDDTVPLLNLPLVVLTDRGCASACDAFAAAVKDLRLGTLVGTRTAGLVSGPAGGFLLGDGSVLEFPLSYGLGPDKEIINTIGVPPDRQAPLTAGDLSGGRDPGLAKAVGLLTSGPAGH